MGRTASLDRSRADDATPLDVRVSVTPEDDCPCPLTDCEPESVRQTLSREDEECTCRLVVDTQTGTTFEEQQTRATCPCPTFEEYECVSELLEVQEDSLLFSVTIPNRDVLAPLIQGLREANAHVSVNRILTAGGEEEAAPDITEKQREAFLLAIEQGYYDRPRGATLEDIASELDITPSAVSQRLTAVKRRLARKYARRYDGKLSG